MIDNLIFNDKLMIYQLKLLLSKILNCKRRNFLFLTHTHHPNKIIIINFIYKMI